MAASMAAASWSPAPPNRWPATRKATPPKPCARCSHDLSSGQSVAQALLPAASPLLGTLLVRHRVAPATRVETSLDTAGTSACATRGLQRRLVSVVLLEFLRALNSGEQTASGLLEICLRRIAADEPEIHAWVEVSPQASLAEGLLNGIPFGVKDIFETRGLATEYGSPLYAGRKGAFDAPVGGRPLRTRPRL